MTNVTDTTTTKLLPLFEQWAEMGSDRCRITSKKEAVIYFNRSYQVMDTTVLLNCPSFLAIIQAVLQEAIVAKGWDMSLHFTAGTDGEAVGWIGEVDIHRLTRPSFWQVFHEAAAIALLTAYLQALKAVRVSV